MNTRLVAMLVSVAFLAAPLTGCLGFLDEEDAPETKDVEQQKADKILGDSGKEQLSEYAAPVPKQYTFPMQDALEPVRVFFNKTIDPAVTASYEGHLDQGGMNYNSIVQTEDVSAYIPEGQPVEIDIKVRWNSKELNGADLDIYVDVPGNQTSYSWAKSEDMNWNVPTKTMTINTVGVAGENHLIGVQAASGKTVEPIDYEMILAFRYADDVLTPFVPWAFDVPENATSLIVESDKVGGEGHITSEFIIIGPDDELVSYYKYNDLAIASESARIPITKPGEYVFYAFYMHGGFLGLRTDAALDVVEARPLARKVTETSLGASPVPGMVNRDWGYGSATGSGSVVTPMNGAQQASFDVAGTHPLDVYAWMKDGQTLGTQVRITSGEGVVHDVQRVLRHDDERGSLGYSGDHGAQNVWRDYANVVKGPYTVDFVNNGNVEIGYTVVTYQR